jgi:hypothetical protein
LRKGARKRREAKKGNEKKILLHADP